MLLPTSLIRTYRYCLPWINEAFYLTIGFSNPVFENIIQNLFHDSSVRSAEKLAQKVSSTPVRQKLHSPVLTFLSRRGKEDGCFVARNQ